MEAYHQGGIETEFQTPLVSVGQNETECRRMASPFDPLQTLQAALAAQANSKEQADILASLREALELQPAPISVLVSSLIGIVVNAGDALLLLKTWVIDLLHFALCRAQLSLEQRTQRSS